MEQVIDQVLRFLQQGVAAILRVVQLVWTWSSDEIAKLLQVPWEQWPLWRQVLLLLLAAVVVWILFSAAVQLWGAAVRILSAFAGLLVTLVATLPAILIAGLVALGGLWALNNFNPSSVPIVSTLSRDDSSNRQAPQNSSGNEDRRTNEAAGK